MKLTNEQKNKLMELAFGDVPNKDIAQQMGIPVTEVYAQRSRLGITREKVARGAAGAQSMRKPATLNPEFEVAVQDMVEPVEVRCVDCAYYACYSKGSSNIMQKCEMYISKEDRRKDYLYDRKHEFLAYMCRPGWSIGEDEYARIKVLLDEVIPDDWRWGSARQRGGI